MNLNLLCTYEENGIDSKGAWFYVAEAVLCLRKPDRLLASIRIRDNRFAITPEHTMNETQRHAVEDRLKSMNLIAGEV